MGRGLRGGEAVDGGGGGVAAAAFDKENDEQRRELLLHTKWNTIANNFLNS